MMITASLMLILVFTDWEDELLVELAREIEDGFYLLDKLPWLRTIKNAPADAPLESLAIAREEAR
jgi:hypothetical protein